LDQTLAWDSKPFGHSVVAWEGDKILLDPFTIAFVDWLREITTNNEIFKKPSKDLLMSILVHLDEEIKHAPGGKERSKLVWLFDRIAPRLEFPEPNSYEVFTEYRLGLPKETE
jgi:hypothetical protein